MSKEIPDWQKRELKLPPWAKQVESSMIEKGKVATVIEIDPDGFYPEWLRLLGAPQKDPDQYWLECALQCAKMDVQAALMHTEFQPSVAGKPVQINIVNRPDWAHKNFKAGVGVKAASAGARIVAAGTEPNTKGSSVPTARFHYVRVRGALPQL